MVKLISILILLVSVKAFSSDLRCYGWKGLTAYAKAEEKVELTFSKSSDRPEKKGEFAGESKSFRYSIIVDIDSVKKNAYGQPKIFSKINDASAIGPISLVRNNPKVEVNPLLGLYATKVDAGNIGCKWE